jgi:glycine oxidase
MAATAWPTDVPRAILYSDHAYVLARGSEALLGSTMEHVGFDGGVTHDGVAQIVAAATRLFPALADQPASRMRTWAGLRPMTPDGRPIVGPDPDVRGLWYATGHGRNGVLLAALTGEIIGNLVTAVDMDMDIAPLAITRFP